MEAGPMTMFAEGGWAMWAVLAMGIPAWFFTVVAGGVIALKRTPIALGLAGIFPTLCGVLSLLLGAVGYFSGMSAAEEAVSLADPQYHDMMLAEGERLAMYPMYFALAMGLIPALVGVVCLIFALTARNAAE